MTDHGVPLELPLVPGRACGSCNVCCVALTIDEAQMQKLPGHRCRHAQRDNGCAIYEGRPRTCRSFFCGWRTLKWVREPLRPDRSGVLVQLHGEISGQDGTPRLGVIVTLLNGAALRAEGLAETVAAAVAAEIPVYLSVPGPPGHTSGRARINDALREAVQRRDKAAVLGILREARAMGRAGEFVPVVLKPHGPDSTSQGAVTPDMP
ncbi:MAG TPA: hypothetical protein VFN46_00680 [Acetobacteraceae bacterium]|nr:hypothetical protein [Acetobacteraceae bacterium]